MDFASFGIAGVTCITVICYLAALAVKQTPLANKWLPSICGALGGVLGIAAMLLYAAVIFLWFKSDKSVGIILAGIWLIQNIGLVIALLGQMSAYLLPLALLLVGVILYFISSR